MARVERGLHLTLDGALADAEPLRDCFVTLLVRGAQQEHLSATGRQREQRALDDRNGLLQRDDVLRGRRLVRQDGQLAVVVLASRAPLPEPVVGQVRRGLEHEGADAPFRVLERPGPNEPKVGLLRDVFGILAADQQITEVAKQGALEADEHAGDERYLRILDGRRSIALISHRRVCLARSYRPNGHTPKYDPAASFRHKNDSRRCTGAAESMPLEGSHGIKFASKRRYEPCFLERTCDVTGKDGLFSADPSAAATLGDVLYRDGGADRRLAERDWVVLVNYIASGDQRALRQIYERTHRLVFTLIARITNSRKEAEHLTVDVFSDLWRRAYSYDPSVGSVLSWIMGQARSGALAWLRVDQELDSEILTPTTPLWGAISSASFPSPVCCRSSQRRKTGRTRMERGLARPLVQDLLDRRAP